MATKLKPMTIKPERQRKAGGETIAKVLQHIFGTGPIEHCRHGLIGVVPSAEQIEQAGGDTDLALKAAHREALAEDVDAFLARGGQVETVPYGASAFDPEGWLAPESGAVVPRARGMSDEPF